MAGPILPIKGTNRRGFDSLIRDIANYYPRAYEVYYVREVEYLIKDIIDNTPIDTGAAAGVFSNSVGSSKRNMYLGHKASGYIIGNMPGQSGWQLEVEQTQKLNISIVNPQWGSYLKWLEYGITEPNSPAKSHFVFAAWKKHLTRREGIRERIARGRRNG